MEDERIGYLEQRICFSLKLKSDKVTPQLQRDDNKKTLTDFLETPETMKLYVILDAKDEILLATAFPPGDLKKKSVYFIKGKSIGITNDNISKVLTMGEFSSNPLKNLNTLLQSIYIPMTAGQGYIDGMPANFQKDVMQPVEQFTGSLYVTLGQTEGKTLLPVPTTSGDTKTSGRDQIHVLESAVVTWSRQIRDCLAKEPKDSALSDSLDMPAVEIEYWETRSVDLESICEQLRSQKIQNVLRILSLSQSTYFSPFVDLIKEADMARREASSNSAYLKPFKAWAERMEDQTVDFENLEKMFHPTLKTLYLVWKSSSYFNKHARLINISRQLANCMIIQGISKISTEEMFSDEPQHGVKKLRACIRCTENFQNTYYHYKKISMEEMPENSWDIPSQAIFEGLTDFMERCHDVLELVETQQQFARLEKIEIGGPKGRSLTESLQQVHADFVRSCAAFTGVTYQILDISAKQFERDYFAFRQTLKELEQRLAAIFTQAYDSMPTLDDYFKLIDSFQDVLVREPVLHEVESRQLDLLAMYDKELRSVLEQFMTLRNSPPVYNNMPPVAGALTWCTGLIGRLEGPMKKFEELLPTFLHSAEAETVLVSHNATIQTLKEFQENSYTEWSANVEEASEEKLKSTLLVQNPADAEKNPLQLRVNFDPMIVRMLREVKYLSLMGYAIPERAMAIYKTADTFRTQTGQLEIISNMYNSIVSSLLEVERPLVATQLEAIDKAMQKGIQNLNWRSHGINDFISNTMALVKTLFTLVTALKQNVSEIEKILATWVSKPLLERKKQKTYSPDEFGTLFAERVAARKKEMEDQGNQIHNLVLKSNRALRVAKTMDEWKDYVGYIHGIVTEGIIKSAVVSFQYLRDQLDEKCLKEGDINPLLEVKLEVSKALSFNPALGASDDKDRAMDQSDVAAIIEKTMAACIDLGSYITRLDTGEGNYVASISEHDDIKALQQSIRALTEEVIASCMTHQGDYNKYEYLWTVDPVVSFEEFVAKYEEDKLAAEKTQEDEEPLPMPVELDRFDERISELKLLQEELSKLPQSQSISWIRVDTKPVRQALLNFAGKRMFQYSDCLVKRVVNNVTELYEFMDESSVTMEDTVVDRNILVKVMGALRDIRKRDEDTMDSFGPLTDTTTLLNKHRIAIPPGVITRLQEAPAKWETVKELADVTKESLGTQQMQEGDKVRAQMGAFNEKVRNFRAEYKANCPFKYEYELEKAYVSMDDFFERTQIILGEARNLMEQQELFEITVTPYKELEACEQEIPYLKVCWDMNEFVTTQFAKWQLTVFSAIDTEALDVGCRALMKDIRLLPTNFLQLREWGVYKGVETAVKNMMTTLPLVQDLRSDAMRDRHWLALQKVCGQKFVVDERFTLDNLLALGLHNFVDDVQGIVDRAQKELIIEKALTKTETTWKAMELIYPQENPGDIPGLRVEEELTEALEENQVQLQNIASSKFVGHFQEQVSAWQKKLAILEQAITTWLDVMRKWANLVAIFIGSQDIREQLPEDSKRFETVDADWKHLMSEAVSITNAVESCNKPGRLELLESMQSRLEMCEKALAEYLEGKRRIFPRFYFVSPTDLLDILSKGAQPHLILRHMGKLFDNVKNLELVKNGEDFTKSATGLYSGEGEFVQLTQPFECEGAVENWLNGLVDSMRSTLKTILQEAISTYKDKPRESWLYDYCAQLALVGSQVWYTTGVNQAFDRLEEGQENALKEYNKEQNVKLDKLISLVQGDLDANDRAKIITMITIDVHQRDIVGQMIESKEDSGTCFAWQSQLRYTWDVKKMDCRINNADAEFWYQYEYLGNAGRLVVTPLTDRCYITLTQSKHLKMGGAPAGPAGTGKTETVKDLGRGLGTMVYVFNCSEQMDYRSLGNIYKGLSMSGAWGCFDEFNRIPIAVLSVVSTQFKTILDAIRAFKTRFLFEGEEINLIATVGVFITMNPGYAGRTELPENLKALFRPVAMIVPDIELICEIMLLAEGFFGARLMSRKFISLYNLNRELLSKQKHYDWGLRAVRSVLVVAGSLKRAEPEISEERILMRALRDLNLPKIVFQDVDIFTGLISDLFPGIEMNRKENPVLQEAVAEVAGQFNFQAGERFVLKCCELEEIYHIRHSVFIIGPSGCGKSTVWKTLARAQTKLGRKTQFSTLNPKAVLSNELYGYIHPASREWKDGLFSIIMRDYSELKSQDWKWMVMDGDIDPEWIESLNTVMDDNKVLTLASNERIPLNKTMRLLFEIANLNNASPATVSRAGIIYMNATDVGWESYVASWIADRNSEEERQFLRDLMEKYLTPILENTQRVWQYVIPLSDFEMVTSLCTLLNSLLIPSNVGVSPIKRDLFEMYFMFAVMWSFGGALTADKNKNYRDSFDRFWRRIFAKDCPVFPEEGHILDYCINNDSASWETWETRTSPYVHNPDAPWGNIVVSTADTTRLSFLMNSYIDMQLPVLFVGTGGTGKTTIIRDRVKNLKDEELQLTANLNSKTTAGALQSILDAALEKKAGRVYGPPGSKKLIVFVDDLNMPFVDLYGTQAPIALLRQHIDYKSWYDRTKMTLKEVHNLQYLAAMNPTAGSFNINPRLQRHFAVFACFFPSETSLKTIFSSIVTNVFGEFESGIVKMTDQLVTAAIELHKGVTDRFLPTAIKFHYQFNLRDLSNVFQGICRAHSKHFTKPFELVRLWLHEATRVYSDRMITETDMNNLYDMMSDLAKKYFDDLDQDALTQLPIAACSFFVPPSADGKFYTLVKDDAKLKQILETKLEEYNENFAKMDLILFEMAIDHVCRISRILDIPRGNALLVGVGGSGKQSLARLASFLGDYEVFQITVSKTYGPADFKLDLLNLYKMTGLKNKGMVFLLTDTQIVDETFLVYINDILSTGIIPDLFPEDEYEGVISAMRNEVKQAGILDSRENCWEFFIEKVRKNLHLALCFSPVGDLFRVRARQFPALCSCTVIDWFHPWPLDALQSVAYRFLLELELGSDELTRNVANHMAFCHQNVNDMSKRYLEQERRYNYTTPKSFLELIALYKHMLGEKRVESRNLQDRFENGLDKLRSTGRDVAELQESLKRDQVLVEEKKKATDDLLVMVGKDQAVAEQQKAIADVQEKEMQVIFAEVTEFQTKCEAELAEAEPAILAAEEALNTLDKKSLTELKSFTKPADEIIEVTSAVLILTSPEGKLEKDLSWASAKKMMASVDKFLGSLISFDKEAIPDANMKAVEKYVTNPLFKGDAIRSKSSAAAGLCEWVRNIVIYYKIFLKVNPMRERLQEANDKLEKSTASLNVIKSKVADLDSKLKKLMDDFEKATEEKNRVIQEAERTKARLELAERLVGGLSDENERWGMELKNLQEQEGYLVGDVLLSSAFVSYIGAFNYAFRAEMINDMWVPDLLKREIPLSDGFDVLQLLTNSSTIAQWSNEGLPTDRLSVENGSLITKCLRWPLIIDPQLQGINWIRNKEAPFNVKILQLSMKNYLDMLEHAIQSGTPVIIENIGEELDAVLDPVLSRSTIKKGRNLFIKLGDKEVEYDKNFRLYLQTKMANPHYRPEISAQTTLINFTVTEKGLEDQLLGEVVNRERLDLEEERARLLKQQNDFNIKLKELEDGLLEKLSNAEGDILADTELIEGLELTKKTSREIAAALVQAQETEKVIDQARQIYRPVAARGSLIYFLMTAMSNIEHMYQYSLEAFMVVFVRAMERTEKTEEVEERVAGLSENITFDAYDYVLRGLFERHKLVFASALTFKILKAQDELNEEGFQFLLRAPQEFGTENPVSEWLSDVGWNMSKALASIDTFSSFPNDLVASARRWKDWCESESPENEKLPTDWKNLHPFERLLVIRCLRGDRMTLALNHFVGEVLGKKYIDPMPFDLDRSVREAGPKVPIFFILSPGVDPVRDTEVLGKKLGFTTDNERFKYLALGQGQEPRAEQYMEHAYKNGGWVMLQNIMLTQKWLGRLENLMQSYLVDPHPEFQLFISSEPADYMPVSILQQSIKLTNEPPAGIRANLYRALNNFSDATWENSSKANEFKVTLFSLCFFHSVVLERRKFGPQGWNIPYPFNTGDLLISVAVLNNYLENQQKIPWVDLRYIFGEIMYGGHISDDWDRRLCNAYLAEYINPRLLESLELFPKFFVPPNTLDHGQMYDYIDENLPHENPTVFGLHPNAEIGFRNQQSEQLFKTVLDLQPRTSGAGGGMSMQDKVKMILDELLDKITEKFDLADLFDRVEERGPFQVVFLQEIERMNTLLFEMERSLKELDLGLKGDLTMSDRMEQLLYSLFDDIVPATWVAVAFPSMKTLGSWVINLLQRHKQLQDWTGDLALPKVTWLSGLFNPQSFLTAVMQTTARKNEWPLDKMTLFTDVTRKYLEGFDIPLKEGAFVHGFILEGARWDINSGQLEDSRMKELFPIMPVTLIRAVPREKADYKETYMCPCYKIQQRGPTFVFTATMKTKAHPNKWIMAGVAILLEVASM